MGSRAAGAFLSIAAAALFVVSLATSAWWSGHPRTGGHSIERKEIHIGLHSASGCNLGETIVCVDLDEPPERLIDPTFRTIGYVELAIGGLAALLALALALATWRLRDARMTLATLVLVVVAASAIGAIVLIVVGPLESRADLSGVSVPIGWGLFVFGGGIVTALAGGVLARRARAEPLRLKMSAPLLAPPVPPAFDVRELLREDHDSVRPSSLGPEPMMGQRPLPPSPGGNLPGPSGPLAPGGANPLFQQAPSLRPLYELGGTNAAPVATPPQLPARAPTPMPRSAIAQLTGADTPLTPIPQLPPRPQPRDPILDGATVRASPPPTATPAAPRDGQDRQDGAAAAVDGARAGRTRVGADAGARRAATAARPAAGAAGVAGT